MFWKTFFRFQKRETYLSFFCVFLFFALFLVGCTEKNTFKKNCTASEILIESTLPEGWSNMRTDETGKKSIHIKAYGVFLHKNIVLTVAHALPPSAFSSDFSVLFRKKGNELLLLKSKKKCGTPLSLHSQSIQKGDSVFFCASQEYAGNILQTDTTTFSSSPFSSDVVPLSGVFRVSGEFSKGDSGRGVCSVTGNLLGILVSVDAQGAFFLPQKKIVDFLADFQENTTAF